MSKRGSILFFCLRKLSAINEMYEYSLRSFQEVFRQSLIDSRPDSILQNRIYNLIEKLTHNIYDYTCLGIFECHKLMFSFEMTTMIMEGEGTLSTKKLDYLLKGNTSMQPIEEEKSEPWISDQAWKDM